MLEAELREARGIRVVRGGVRPEKVLSRSEVERLCNGMSARGALFVRFLYATGCRVSEIIGVRGSDVQAQGTRAEIEITGKGGKVRRVRISSGLLGAVRETFQGRTWLFETSTGRPYARQYVSDMIRRAAARVLNRGQIGAHSLRHSAATALIKGGSGVQAIGEYLGHADPATTLRFYVHQAVSDEELGTLELGDKAGGRGAKAGADHRRQHRGHTEEQNENTNRRRLLGEDRGHR